MPNEFKQSNMSLKLELGKWYETRQGRAVQIIKNNGTDIWEWDGIVCGNVESWRYDGRYYGSNRDCPADLVKEIEPPKANTNE